MKVRDPGLIKAIHILTVTGLAEKIGVTPQAVTNWHQVPANRVLAVEAATNGKVHRSELRPDLYPADEYQPKKQRKSKCPIPKTGRQTPTRANRSTASSRRTNREI